jgi:3-methylfumaryl-CoA hydratase
MTDLSNWIGRELVTSETLDAMQLTKMAATMDRPLSFNKGEKLPAGWHWLFFNQLEAQANLGPDGHPRRGNFLPPVELPRRMWAGSRLHWHAPFLAGHTVTRTARVLDVTEKAGKSGQMIFVKVGYTYRDGQTVLLEEEHDIVYRDDPPRDANATAVTAKAPDKLVFEREGAHLRKVTPDPVLLFRYSAVTFNGHRIHYDADYVRNVEGYPGLIVHGPLIATFALDFIEFDLAPGRSIEKFSFRMKKPTFDYAPFHLHASASADGKGYAAWTSDNNGQVALDGDIVLA